MRHPVSAVFTGAGPLALPVLRPVAPPATAAVATSPHSPRARPPPDDTAQTPRPAGGSGIGGVGVGTEEEEEEGEGEGAVASPLRVKPHYEAPQQPEVCGSCGERPASGAVGATERKR